jgi:hypothetical protein
MRILLACAALLFGSLVTHAQSDIEFYTDPLEVRLPFPKPVTTDAILQQELREAGGWKYFANDHNGWYAMMSAEHGQPHRAWGKPLDIPGGSTLAKADWFVNNEMRRFGVDPQTLSAPRSYDSKKHSFVRYTQVIEGIEVKRSDIVLKFHDGRLIMFGCDYYDDPQLPEGALLSAEALDAFAVDGVNLDLMETQDNGLYILPVPQQRGNVLRYAREIIVSGYQQAVPKRYQTYVDAQTGEILARTNLVKHAAPGDPTEPKEKPKKVLPMGLPVVISGQFEGTVHPLTVLEATEVLPLPYVTFELDGQSFTADENGGFITNVTGPANGEISLSGSYCEILTGGQTPSFNLNVSDGYTVISFDQAANIRERSTYRNTNLIWEHMKEWLPSFTDLDYPLPTNIDVVGECNAFYNGTSINFYPDGGGCNSTALLGDVVYHEYGHAINDKYYQSLGSFYNNGAMNEGYADFWALSETQSPLLAQGFYTDNDDPLRRYDIDPKIYPEDLIGQVHNDGEIICGAWFATHLLMGEDWDQTIGLFVEAFDGLQATAFNGNEGQAYTDVLLDALQADDDDGNLNNGTPNGDAIIQGFDTHGITLFAYADIEHEPVEFAAAESTITLEASAEIVFPFGQYFESMKAYYRFGPNEEWQVASMTQEGDDFTVQVPGQEEMTVIQYYFGIQDVFGGISAVNPVAANKEVYPNLPFFTLVGVMPVLINDSDDFSDFGFFDLGVSGDNAETGEWDEVEPVGSFADPMDPSSIVAPTEDHTPVDFGFCFVTGENPGEDAAIGANDVDAGSTTLQSPVVDLTSYEDPVLAYWRWYVNAPPSGANPGADWWQVEVSDDGGSSWERVENTLTQDISWRRNAIKISDYVDLTEDFRFRFIASDSIRPGQNLDGGSLIEAAVDDIVLYDVDDGTGIDELGELSLNLYPNPADRVLQVNLPQTGGTLDIIDARGRAIRTEENVQILQREIEVSGLAPGNYFLRYTLDDGRQLSKLFQIRR